jgi:hypothetical protein
MFRGRGVIEGQHPWVDEGELDLAVARGTEEADLGASMPNARKFRSALVFWLPVHQTWPL